MRASKFTGKIYRGKLSNFFFLLLGLLYNQDNLILIYLINLIESLVTDLI